MVACLLNIEVVTNAGTEGGNHRLNFSIGQGAVQASALNVQDLTAQRQNSLSVRVATLNSRTTRRVTLHQVNLRDRRVLRGAVLELTGHGAGLQQALTAGRLACLTGCNTRLSGGDRAAHDILRHRGVTTEPVAEVIVHLTLGEGLSLRVTQLGLGLTLELRLRNLNRNHRGQALTHVFTGEVIVLIAQQLVLTRVTVHQRGQSGTETLFVSTALVGVNRVRVRVDGFLVGAGPLHRHFQAHIALSVFGFEGDNLLVHDGLRACVEEVYVVEQAVVVTVGDSRETLSVRVHAVEDVFLLLTLFSNLVTDELLALIGQGDSQALVQERHLLETGAQSLKVELDGLENLWVRVESLDSAGLIGRFTLAQGTIRHTTVGEGNMPCVALAVHLGNHAGGQRVHHGDTHTVQTTGNGVAATAKLTASVQHGHDDLNSGLVLGGVLIHGNTATVILYANSTISLDGHVNFGGVAGERFVDRVIYDLVDQVVQTALSGRANVHAGALTNRFQTFQHGNIGCTVFMLLFRCILFRCHEAELLE